MQEVKYSVGRDHEQAVGLAVHRCQLGDELGSRDARRAGDTQFIVDLAADQPADGGWTADPSDGARDIEEPAQQRLDLG
jgi:hypothetical protein